MSQDVLERILEGRRSQPQQLVEVLQDVQEVFGYIPQEVMNTVSRELGVPVTLVDSSPDLNEKLSNEEFRLSSGLTLNYALRPGLLRILRNPRIRCVMPGQVMALKHSPQGFSARLKGCEPFVDAEKCTLCGRCAEVCPVSRPDGSKPIQYNGRRSLPGRPFIDKRNEPLCQSNCPLGVNVQGYMALVGASRFAEALDLIRRDCRLRIRLIFRFNFCE